MCRQLKLDNAENKKLLCIGLHSKDLCNVLMSKTHVDEKDLLRDIRDFTEVNAVRAKRFKKTSTVNDISADDQRNSSAVAKKTIN